MDKDGIFENLPADLQHFNQGRLTLQGPLEGLGPEVIFVKNLLDFVVDLQGSQSSDMERMEEEKEKLCRSVRPNTIKWTFS